MKAPDHVLFGACILITLLLFIAAIAVSGQSTVQTTTVVSNDSIQRFSVSSSSVSNRKKKLDTRKIYYSFENFRLTPQVGARSQTFLHGNFENRSMVTNRLYAKGQFRNGVKHGEWRLWNADGTMKSIEYWKNGKLKRRSYLNTSQATSATGVDSATEGEDNSKKVDGQEKNDAASKTGRAKWKRIFHRNRPR